MKKALIVGMDSVIGLALKKELQCAGWTVYGTTRRKKGVNESIIFLDLAKPVFDSTLLFDVVFLCASITQIITCEASPTYSKLINQDAQITLAQHFLNKGSHVIFLSTNAVFSGEKPFYRLDDVICPNTVYGKHKAAVEHALVKMSGMISIVRLSKVLTIDYPLIKQWISELKNGHIVVPFYDLHLCPISISIISRCLKEIAERQLLGYIHLSGEEDVSYLHLANCIADFLSIDHAFIKPKSVMDIGKKITPSSYFNSLDMIESKKLFGLSDMSLVTTLKGLYFP